MAKRRTNEPAAETAVETASLQRFVVEIPHCLHGRQVIEAKDEQEAIETYMRDGGVIKSERLPIVRAIEEDVEQPEVTDTDGNGS